jgi:hypothetical protein
VWTSQPGNPARCGVRLARDPLGMQEDLQALAQSASTASETKAASAPTVCNLARTGSGGEGMR